MTSHSPLSTSSSPNLELGEGGPSVLEDEISYRRFDGSEVDRMDLVQDLCDRILPHRPTGLVEDRMAVVSCLDLFLAEYRGVRIGFKLGYRTSATVYLSWLGGVDQGFRRRGIASRLTEFQHRYLMDANIRAVETYTRSNNAAMLIVNLSTGFHIVGTETDSYGRFLVLQRKVLSGLSESGG